MALGENIRRTMRHITLTAYKRASQIDNLEDLAESQLTDIRTVCSGSASWAGCAFIRVA